MEALMTTRFERKILTQCAARAMAKFPARSAAAGALFDWLEDADLGIDDLPESDRFRRRGIAPRTWRAARNKVEEAYRAHRNAKPDTIAQNVRMLAKHAGLDDIETMIFHLAVRYCQGDDFEELCDCLSRDSNVRTHELLAYFLGTRKIVVREALKPSSRLMQSGLLSVERRRRRDLSLEVSDRFVLALGHQVGNAEEIIDNMFQPPTEPEIEWEDFDHLGENGKLALDLIQNSLSTGERGINLLLYGEPGVGKTEFCKVLAQRLGVTLRPVGEADEDGEEPSRRERIQQLRLGQKLLAGRPDTLILFDEMEDVLLESCSLSLGGMLFGSRMQGGRGASKVHMHRLLENNSVPTLWTMNHVQWCDPAILRRMTFAIEMRKPSQRVRQRVWRRLADRHGLTIDNERILGLARRHEVAPALLASGLKAAILSGGSLDNLDLAVNAAGKLQRGGLDIAPDQFNETPFRLNLVNSDRDDLKEVTDALLSPEVTRRISLCISGPPGTGKSAFVRHLAEEMDMPVLQKRASDLLDMYVGQTEHRIARAFAEARDQEAFLIFDEADSLLDDRRSAVRSWEKTRVNEMLTWMESHPLPFACTTNLVSHLDKGTQRRFTFHLRFDPLTGSMLRTAFEVFFSQKAPSGVERLDRLTPGDFATVKRRAEVLGIRDAKKILEELKRENLMKSGGREEVGFRNGH